MKSRFDDYQRLARGAMGMSSLWLGPDHLVYVRGWGVFLPFTEEYRRFRYRDIQHFTLERTARTARFVLYSLAILAAVAAIALVYALGRLNGIGPLDLSAMTFFGLFGGLFLFLLLRHLVLGPTCRCVMGTSGGKTILRPLSRLHASREAIERAAGSIRPSQEDLLARPAADHPDESAGTPPGVGAALGVPRLVVPGFAGLALFALSVLASLHLESPVAAGVAMFLCLVGGLLLLSALTISVRRPTPEAVRTALWTNLGLLFLFCAAMITYYAWAAYRHPEYTIELTGMFEAFAAAATVGGAAVYWPVLGLSLAIFAVSLAGIAQALKWKNLLATDPPSP